MYDNAPPQVGVGAEEIVCGQDQDFVTFSDQENEILLENQAVGNLGQSWAISGFQSNYHISQVFPDCESLKIEQDFNGVHYEADEVRQIRSIKMARWKYGQVEISVNSNISLVTFSTEFSLFYKSQTVKLLLLPLSWE